MLEKAGYRVLPEALRGAGGDLATIQAARKERLQTLRRDVHALLLLRDAANATDQDVDALVSDRAALQAFDVDLPCAILDRVGNSARAAELGIDTIDARAGGWVAQLDAWLATRRR